MERPFQRPTVASISARLPSPKPNNMTRVVLARCGCFTLLTPAFVSAMGGDQECWTEHNIPSTNVSSPSDPSRIDEARPPSWSECQRTAWPPLSIPLQGTTRGRIALYGRFRPEERGKYGQCHQRWAGEKRVTYKEGPCLRGKLRAR